MWFCDSASLFSSMNRNKSYIQAIVNVLLNISKIKVNWKKKTGAEQSVCICFWACYKYQEMWKCWKMNHSSVHDWTATGMI